MNGSFTSKSTSVSYNTSILQKTYLLLGFTLLTTAVASLITMLLNLKTTNLFFEIIIMYGLMFAISYNSKRNENLALTLLFLFSFYLGYLLAPILNAYLAAGMGNLITLSFGLTALDFFALTGFVFITKKNFNFLSGAIFSGFIVAIALMVLAFFVNIPALYLGISGLFVIISSMFILYQTSSLVRGEETNYILATLNIYISLYNIFLSLLQILGAFNGGRK